MRYLVIFSVIFLIGAGCVSGERFSIDQRIVVEPNDIEDNAGVGASSEAGDSETGPVVFPIDDYASRRTYLTFGDYVENRFTGYHLGDDIEYTDTFEEVPVFAIADGTVLEVRNATGYGGVMLVAHDLSDGESVNAIYGHIDLSSVSVRVGERVERGQQIAVLGEHESDETDGERKHLHFALYKGGDIRLLGYGSTPAALQSWINPEVFFLEQGLELTELVK